MTSALSKWSGRPGAWRYRVFMSLAVAWTGFAYWGWGGILDARKLAKKSPTIVLEYLLGLSTLVLGVWWAVYPQPLYNLFGNIEAALPPSLPFRFSALFGAVFALAGRNLLHSLVRGDDCMRCSAARLVCAAYAFLVINQVLIDWRSAGLPRLVFACYACLMIHDHVCKATKCGKKSRKTTKRLKGEEATNSREAAADEQQQRIG